MKESEIENAPEAWRSAVHSYEFANYMVQLNPEDYGITLPTNTGENPADLDELVLLKNKVTIPAFESIILHCRTRKTMMMGYKLHVMTQATYPEDRSPGGRSQQVEGRGSGTSLGCLEGIRGTEIEVYDGAHIGFCRFQETIPVRN